MSMSMLSASAASSLTFALFASRSVCVFEVMSLDSLSSLCLHASAELWVEESRAAVCSCCSCCFSSFFGVSLSLAILLTAKPLASFAVAVFTVRILVVMVVPRSVLYCELGLVVEELVEEQLLLQLRRVENLILCCPFSSLAAELRCGPEVMQTETISS